MLVDLTTNVPQDSPLLEWARSQDRPHIAMGHVGTHLDTYEKSEVPIDYFETAGVVFDVRGIEEVFPEDVSVEDIPEGGFAIFRTGRIEEHPYGGREYFDDHPQLSHRLIGLLCEKRVRLVGVDCPGVRRGDEHEEADRLLEKNGTYVVENLCNLGLVSGRKVEVYTMWLDDEEMTGLRCRVIARVNDQHSPQSRQPENRLGTADTVVS